MFPFLSPIERILVASRGVRFYLSKLSWPSNLTFIYPRWNVSPAHLLDYIWLLAGLGACVAIYFLRRHFGRSVEVAAAFFVATLSPVLGFIMLFTFRYTFVADHYQYVACIGPVALASAAIVGLTDTFNQYRTMIVSVAIVAVASLGVLTWRQARMYSDIETLWRTTLARNPGCWMADTNLGLVLFQKGQIDDAIAHYRSALQMQPEWWDAEYNLGTALLAKGQAYEAIVHCQRAVAMRPTDPDAQVSLGDALLAEKRIDEAISHYQQALAMRPDYFLAHYGLGRALLDKGELDGAIQNCRAALLTRPGDPDCHTVLAICLKEKGETAEAIQQYEQALKLYPKSVSALTNLAWILATCPDGSLRDGSRAVEIARRANQLLGGTNTFVLRALAAAYAESRQFEKATKTAQDAIQLARMHRDDSSVAELEQDIALYRLGIPYRELGK